MSNLKYDRQLGNIRWNYNGMEYSLNTDNLLCAEEFEKDKTVLVLCGNYSVETHLYAYDLCGKFKFEVFPPENYRIMCIGEYTIGTKGPSGMGMACMIMIKSSDCFDSIYCIDSETGELTYAGRMKF